MKREENMKKRIIMSVLGVMIGAVSVAIFKMAAFGVDPFQSFMSGSAVIQSYLRPPLHRHCYLYQPFPVRLCDRILL